MNRELPNVQAGLEKGEKPEIKLTISIGSSKKQESFRKTSTSVSLITPNGVDFDGVDGGDHNKLENSS